MGTVDAVLDGAMFCIDPARVDCDAVIPPWILFGASCLCSETEGAWELVVNFIPVWTVPVKGGEYGRK